MPVQDKRSLIAIVDDDDDVREAIRGLMRAMGYAAEAFSSGAAFLRSPHVTRTACLIADVNMPAMTGLDLQRRLSERGHPTPTILITAYPTEELRSRADAAGVVRFLTKPFVEADLVEGVRSALARNSK